MAPVDASPESASGNGVSSARLGKRPNEGGGNIRLVVFDFDQTLSAVHLFGSLAGTVGPNLVPEPYAASEKGQMRRVEELCNSTAYQERCPRFGFLGAAFGGDERVLELRGLLADLKKRGTELVICTRGLVGTVQLCLQKLGMMDYFTEVYGNIGSHYGEKMYDQASANLPDELTKLLGREDQAGWGTKDVLIRRLMVQRKMSFSDVLFVDDDEEEIQRAQATCQTLWVADAEGIRLREFDWLLRNCVDDAPKRRRNFCDADFSQCAIL